MICLDQKPVITSKGVTETAQEYCIETAADGTQTCYHIVSGGIYAAKDPSTHQCLKPG